MDSGIELQEDIGFTKHIGCVTEDSAPDGVTAKMLDPKSGRGRLRSRPGRRRSGAGGSLSPYQGQAEPRPAQLDDQHAS
jgi:hypothetical protein